MNKSRGCDYIVCEYVTKQDVNTETAPSQHKQTFSAPLLAEEEAAAGSGAGGAGVLSKSSNAPVRKGKNMPINF